MRDKRILIVGFCIFLFSLAIISSVWSLIDSVQFGANAQSLGLTDAFASMFISFIIARSIAKRVRFVEEYE